MSNIFLQSFLFLSFFVFLKYSNKKTYRIANVFISVLPISNLWLTATNCYICFQITLIILLTRRTPHLSSENAGPRPADADHGAPAGPGDGGGLPPGDHWQDNHR